MNEARLRTDHQRLLALAGGHPELVRIERASGRPPTSYRLVLRCRGVGAVAGSTPMWRDEHIVEVDLGGDYPFIDPDVRFVTPIFHPHVWTDGRLCMGDWLPTQFLDLLVDRVFRIIQYDPGCLDPRSVANHAAEAWLSTNRRAIPFGTVTPLGGECGTGAPPEPPERPKIRFEPISSR